MKIIQKATQNQSQEIFALFQACAKHLQAQGILQWDENYPTLAHVEAAIATNSLFVFLENQKLKGSISIDENQDITYQNILWKYPATKILVIHRLAVHPNFQRKGIAKKLMDFAENYAIQNQYEAIRLDAFSANERTLRFYRNRNYEENEKIYLNDNPIPCICFEKRILSGE